ncbi:MarR family winged helix-turn-helix transcriptional regulator [Aquabacterium sp. J223]|uniref:MarR family winged helix-turn-helix transcriptional regulator n=1 Tax=Aquabacterium sp. J223 TaxID=2898431 RepID=UPI0021ADD766|nr:MarR family transcriptional regulator [Aquabacterium sp. J223]UUX95633.1 MarR family transcriptional regulator [Aquabacterium sp. J223]
MLADLSGRHAELRYSRLFGLRAVECRVIVVTAALGPLTLRALCEETHLQKSHASRLVSRLVEQGYLERREDPADQRSFYLVATPKGRRLHREAHAEAHRRNQEWLTALDGPQRAAFVQALDRLTDHSRRLLADASGAVD